MTTGAETTPLLRLLELASELQRLRTHLLSEAIPDSISDSLASNDDDEVPDEVAKIIEFLSPQDPVTKLKDALTHLRALHLVEPTIAEAVLAFLTGVGKDYAATEEGAVLLGGLHRSEAAEQLRRLWVALSLNTIDVEPDLSARSWTDTVLDLSLSGDLSRVTRSLRPDGLA